MAMSFAGHSATESVAASGGQDIGTWMMSWGVGIGMLTADAEKAQANAALAAASAALSAVATSGAGAWPPAGAALQNLINALNALVAAAQAQQRANLIPSMQNIVKMLSGDLAALSAQAAPPPPPPAPPPAYVAPPAGPQQEVPVDQAGYDAGLQWAPPDYAAPAAAAPAAAPPGYALPPEYAVPAAPPAAPAYDPAAAPAAPAYDPAAYAQPPAQGYAQPPAQAYAPPPAPAYAPPPPPAAPAPAPQYTAPYGSAADPAAMHGTGRGGRGLNPAFQMHYHHHAVMHSIAQAVGQEVKDWFTTWGLLGLGALSADREMQQCNTGLANAAALCSQINAATGKAPAGTKDALMQFIADIRGLAYAAEVQQQIRFVGTLESLADQLNNEVNGRGHFKF
jgi:hypothetical protein